MGKETAVGLQITTNDASETVIVGATEAADPSPKKTKPAAAESAAISETPA